MESRCCCCRPSHRLSLLHLQNHLEHTRLLRFPSDLLLMEPMKETQHILLLLLLLLLLHLLLRCLLLSILVRQKLLLLLLHQHLVLLLLHQHLLLLNHHLLLLPDYLLLLLDCPLLLLMQDATFEKMRCTALLRLRLRAVLLLLSKLLLFR